MTTDRDDDRKQSEEKAAAFHRIWLAGLGALQSAESEGRELFRKLVERGEEFASKARPTVDRLRDRTTELSAELREGAEKSWDRLERMFDERLAAAMSRLGVPGRDELRHLSTRVEQLTKKIETLAAERGTPTKKRAARKTAKKTAKKRTRKATAKAAGKSVKKTKKKTAKKTTGKSARKRAPAKPRGARKRS